MSCRYGWLGRWVPRWTGAILPFMLLPALVLVSLSVVLGPRLGEAISASYQFCQSYIMHVPPSQVALSLAGILGGIAIIAGALGILRETGQLRRLARSLNGAGAAPAPPILGRTVMLVPDRVPFAFCHGLLRPRIYLSTALLHVLDERELDAVLRHEEVHRCRRDPLKVLAVRTLAAALFFLPLARVVRDRCLVWLEIQADHEVVRVVGREPLAAALVKLLQPGPGPVITGAISRFNPTEERVKRLLAPAVRPRLALLPGQALLSNGVLILNVGVMAGAAVVGANWFLMGPFVCPMPAA